MKDEWVFNMQLWLGFCCWKCSERVIFGLPFGVKTWPVAGMFLLAMKEVIVFCSCIK